MNQYSSFTYQAEPRFRLSVLNIAIGPPDLTSGSTLLYRHGVTQLYDNEGCNAIRAPRERASSPQAQEKWKNSYPEVPICRLPRAGRFSRCCLPLEPSEGVEQPPEVIGPRFEPNP